jgi:D-sedoheptulose 7-phosphate isomerase
MNKFPIKIFKDSRLFFEGYFSVLNNFLQNKNLNKLINISNEIYRKIINKKKIFICGNGGSGSIADHFLCDFMKGVSSDTYFKPKIISLNSNPSLLSAIANDLGYDKIFEFQLDNLAKAGDLIVLLSCSGNSKNIIRAIKLGKKKKVKIIGFTGFQGGYLKKNSDINFHVNISNYGIVEDIFQITMHCMSQFIRQKYLKNKKIKKNKFF